MTSAVIVSVGGTTAPVVNTLKAEVPGFVCFLASHQSVDQIAEIKRELGVKFDDEKVLVDDHEDLIGCYRQALECLRRVEARGFMPAETVVDYTGGTKAMTAGLAMAAASHGVRFSYVGGTRRNKANLGTVESGSERRRVEVDPLRLFAVEEKRRIALYFNQYQYPAAAAALRQLGPSQKEPERSLLESLLRLTEGYVAWEQFDHAAAFCLLVEERRRLEERCRVSSASEYAGVLDTVSQNLAFLGELKGRTSDFEKKAPLLATDLMANAGRRIEEGKFDDAVARLYRTVELIGQCVLEEKLGVESGNVPVRLLPSDLQEEFRRKYSEDGESCAFGLFATYRVLAKIGHPHGEFFQKSREEMEKIMDARNRSILAHGTRPIGARAATRLRDIVARLVPERPPGPTFPRLPW